MTLLKYIGLGRMWFNKPMEGDESPPKEEEDDEQDPSSK